MKENKCTKNSEMQQENSRCLTYYFFRIVILFKPFEQ